MASVRSGSTSPQSESVMVRLDAKSKAALKQAAALRGVSVSDYVRLVTVAQAEREVKASANQTISLSAEEQLAFWNALHQPAKLTTNQRTLAALMRGET